MLPPLICKENWTKPGDRCYCKTLCVIHILPTTLYVLVQNLLHWHVGSSPVHIVPVRHSRVTEPTTANPSSQEYVATVPTSLDGGVMSGS